MNSFNITFEQKITSVQWPKPIDADLDTDNDNIQGMGGKDYPIYSSVPKTSFTCNGKINGFYADMEAECQSFHLCLNTHKTSFLCGNGTVFNQRLFTCNWWFNTTCKESSKYYSLNSDLYKPKERTTERPKEVSMGFVDHKNINSDRLVDRPKFVSRLPPIVPSLPIKSADEVIGEKNRYQGFGGVQHNPHNGQNVRQLVSDNYNGDSDQTEEVDEQQDYEN